MWAKIGFAAWSVVVVAVCVGGCSKSDGGGAATAGSPAGGSGGGAGMPAGGSVGSSGMAGTGGKPQNGPAISIAPPAWVRPADCGGVGDTCPEGIFGCTGTTSVCQLEGYVCIPAYDSKQGLPSRTMETPYCAAYTCMTFDQASCFCTGDAGKKYAACQSPKALAGLCGTDGASCDKEADCCDGSACLPTAYYPTKACRTKCETNEDCGTGCCTDSLDTGVKICSEASKCETACVKQGITPCSQPDPNKPTLCCRGTCVLSENPNHAGCRPRCSKNEDCFDTGCCLPFDGSTEGFCADAKFCSCGAPGAACGGTENPPCCGGSICLTYDKGTSFSCYANCASDADCPGSCCQKLNADSTEMVCGPPSNCQ